MSAPTQTEPDPPAHFLRVALIVAGAFFMENLDGTVIVTALPQIGRSFAVPATDLSLGVTAYMLALAAFIPTGGWMADRFGARNVFVAAILLFTAASVMCGLSSGYDSFMAARVVQGVAAALMSPVGRLAVLRNARKHEIVRAMATLTWPALIAPVIGPAVGGFITTYASWRWIFFLNLPLGLIGATLALIYVPDPGDRKRAPFDTKGFFLAAGALTGLVYGLDLLSRRDAQPGPAVALIMLGAALGAWAWRHLRRAEHPLMDLGVMRVKSFVLAAVSSGSAARIAIAATPFLLPLMFQLVFGLSPLDAGLLVLVYMAGNLAMKTITTPMLRWFGFRDVLVINGLFNAAAIFACGLLHPGIARPLMLAVLFLAGAFRSMNFTAVNTLAFAEVAPDQRSGANALWGVAQQVSFSLGVAVAAVLLNLSLTLRGEAVLSLADFRFAFMAMGALALVAAVWFARLPAETGREVSGHKRPA